MKRWYHQKIEKYLQFYRTLRTIPVEKVEEKEGVIDVVSMIRPPRLIGFGSETFDTTFFDTDTILILSRSEKSILI